MSLRTWFPKLALGNHRITSNADINYNCIAWSNGDNSVWWEPHAGYHWPLERIPDDEEPSVDHVAAIFEAAGFERRERYQVTYETGYDRIAIYGAARDRFTHVAHQIESGWWASKIGPDEDIEHATTDVLEGNWYGQVALILRRSRLWKGPTDRRAT